MTIEAKLDNLIELNQKILAVLTSTKDTSESATSEKPKRTRKTEEAPAQNQSTASSEKPTASDDDFLSDDPKPEAVTVDKNAVRAALVEYQKVSSGADARALLKKFGGVDELGTLATEKYAAVHAAAKAATAAKSK